MANTNTEKTCPSIQQYQQLVSGLLPENDRDSLLAHLETCDGCAQKMSTLHEPDTLVGMLRRSDTLDEAASREVIAQLVARMSKLRPPQSVADARTITRSSSDHVEQTIDQPAVVAKKETYDFLAPAQQPDELGRLGPYRVLEVLGSGGMGVVFRAEDPQLARQVALKAMLPGYVASDSARQRFLREARASAAIKHDHIVSIYQVGEDRGVLFLAMELLEGESLDARMQREGKLPPAEVARIGKQIAQALAAAHKRGLIHRDIKPANIWLEARDQDLDKETGRQGDKETRRQGDKETGEMPLSPGLPVSLSPCLDSRVKILDFGLARTNENAQLTQQGAIVGTPAYMAPEQGKGKQIDHRCDLFSLGCVLYRMATGAAPFHGTDVVSTLMSVATEVPKSPRMLEPKLPKALSDLIVNLLEKDAANRPATAQVVVEKLDLIAQELARPQKPRRWWPAVAAAAAFLIVLAGGIVYYIQTPDGVVRIEIDDPSIKLAIEGHTAIFTHEDKDKPPITLKPGKHGLRITRGDFIFDTASFELPKRGKTALKVTWHPGQKIEVKQDNKVIAAMSLDPDRRAAEWVLSIGGGISIKENDQERQLGAAADLPKGPFKLTVVNLISNSKVSDAGLANFKDCKNLTSLDLAATKVSDAGLVHFKDCKNLTELILRSTPVGDAGLAHFKDCKKLTSLDLGGTKVSDAGLALFKDCKNLSELHLNDSPVSDAGLAHFKDCKNFTYLHLNSTQVGDAGLAHFKDCKNVTKLVLHHTKVSDAGLAHFKDCKNLTYADLHATQVGDAGLVHLKDCKSLTDLILAGTQVSDAGLAHLKNCKNLTGIHLSATQVSDVGLEGLAGWEKLGFVNVTKTQVTEAVVRKLSAALPLCKIESDYGTFGPSRFSNSLGMEFALVPKGKAWLGGGGGEVGTIEKDFDDFYLGVYEVTQEEWENVMSNNPSIFKAVGGFLKKDQRRFPVESVSWEDAQIFLAKLNDRVTDPAWTYRLPTSAEWEYACRGGPQGNKLQSKFDYYLKEPTLELLPGQANFRYKDSLERTSKVGSYQPNALGLYDLHGNVWEWCENLAPPDPLNPKAPAKRLARGGSWGDVAATGNHRAAAAFAQRPEQRDAGLGLRVARVRVRAAPVPLVGRKADVYTVNPYWSVADGELLFGSDEFKHQWMFFGDKNWTDYDFQARLLRLRAGSGMAGVSLAFRSTGPNFENTGLFSFGSKGAALVFNVSGKGYFANQVNGSDVPALAGANEKMANNRWYTLKVEVRGSTVRCFLDGKPQGTFDKVPFSRGRVGLHLGPATYRFRDFQVTAPDGTVLWNGVPDMPASPLPVPAAFAPPSDPDRRAAEFVLSIGGAIQVNELPRHITALTDLPSRPLELTGLMLPNGKKVTDDDMANFKGCKNLTRLDLGFTHVSDAGLANFKDCTKLTALGLTGYSGLTDAGLAHFKDCKELTSLTLYDLKISSVGLAHFKDCKKLTQLDLRATALTNASLAPFKDCKDLKVLNLQATGMQPVELAYFTTCQKLESVNLDRTIVNDGGLVHLKDLTNLKWLDLNSTRVTDAGLVHLKGLGKLQHLELKRTNVTADEVKKLAGALTKCTIVSDHGTYGPSTAAEPDRRAAFVQGNWKISGDVIEHPDKDKRALLLFGRPDFGDGDFTCEVFRSEGDNGLALVARATDLDNYYYFDIGVFKNTFHSLYSKETGSNWRRIDQKKAEPVPTDKWVTMRLRFRGDSIEGFLEDKLVVSGKDDRRLKGYVGLRTWNEAGKYRNLKFTDSAGRVLWSGLPELLPANVADPDRRAAASVLAIADPDGHTHLTIRENGKERHTRELPAGPFELTGVILMHNLKVKDADLASLKDCKNLTVLSLGYTTIGDAGVAHFKECDKLTTLILPGNVTNAGLANFKQCKNLTSLTLHGLRVDDAGLAHFSHCKDLTLLSLRSSGLKDITLKHFKDCKKLTVLDLADSGLSPAELVHFKECKDLTHLDLAGIKTGDKELAYFYGCKNLTLLQLATAKISDKGLAPLKDCKKLNALVLLGTGVSNRAIDDLRKALPKCNIQSDAGIYLDNRFTNTLGMEFAFVPKGKAWFGGMSGTPGKDESEMPYDFYLGVYEVTQEEWLKVMSVNPSHFSREGKQKDAVKDISDADLKRFPVDNVSWDDCQEFLARLNEKVKDTGWKYSLPTEKEWQYACRGGSLPKKEDYAFDFYFQRPTNVLLPDKANFDKNVKRPQKVGSYEPNRLGLYDMHGNMGEWCDDAVKDAKFGTARATRGGGWGHEVAWCRAVFRVNCPSNGRFGDIGLRVARVPVGRTP